MIFAIFHQISMVFLRFSYNFGDFCQFSEGGTPPYVSGHRVRWVNQKKDLGRDD